MTSSPNQPDMPLYVTPPPSPPRIQMWATKIGEVVRSGLMILFWLVVAAAGLAASFIVLKGIWWGIRLIQIALGMP